MTSAALAQGQTRRKASFKAGPATARSERRLALEV
jgi:hypothetical protein